MGKVLSILNFKGGVGKTTLAAHISRSLMENQNKRILLIDLDPQFNLTQLLMLIDDIETCDTEKRTAHRLFSVIPGGPISARMAERAPAPEAISVALSGAAGQKPGPAVHLVPGSFELARLAITQNEEKRKLAAAIFREFLSICRKHYDATILDLNPGVSPITYTAIDQSDHMLTPFINEKYAFKGVILIKEFLSDFFPDKMRNDAFLMSIMNMVSPDGMSRETLIQRDLRKEGVFIFDQKVPNSSALRTHARMSGTVYDPQISRMRSKGEVTRIRQVLSELTKQISDRIPMEAERG